MSYKHILAIDPSGSFEDGKGTTGFCIFDCEDMNIIQVFYLKAENFDSKEKYWARHSTLIHDITNTFKNCVVVIEEFMLDPSRAKQQSYSKMETSKLIGIMQVACWEKDIPYVMQRAAEVKQRWKDKILVYKNYLTTDGRHYFAPKSVGIVGDHCRDAIRHAVHFATFKNKGEHTNGRQAKNQ